MITLLRHDGSVNREDDGAVNIEDLASIFRSRIISSWHWSTRTDPNSPKTFQYTRAIQGHAGGTLFDPIIQSGLIPGGKCQQRKACGVLHSRESAQRSGVRPEDFHICSVQNQWKIHTNTVF